MKKINITYWIFTGLFAAFMLSSAIPNIICNADSIALMNTLLGYPIYFIPFIGVAKLLGVIGILIPGYPRVKEWAYAGLVFDLVGATYSMIAIGSGDGSWIFMFLPIIFAAGSYISYHKKLKATAAMNPAMA